MKRFNLDRLIKDAVRKHGCIVGEPKNLNNFILNTERKTGEVYGQSLKKIFALKEQIIDHGEKVDYRDLKTKVEDLSDKDKPERYKHFVEVLVNHVNYGKFVRKGLEKKWNEAKETLKHLEDSGAGSVEIRNAKKAVQETSDELFSLIEIIGHDSNEDYIKYTDIYGIERECINYFKCLKGNPRLFLEKIKDADDLSACVHIRDSRNIPHPEAIDEAIWTLKDIENQEGARRYIKNLNYQIQKNN